MCKSAWYAARAADGRTPGVCPRCGKQIELTLQRGRPPTYCSRACYSAARADRVRRESEAHRAARRCRTCGSSLAGRNLKAVYCSEACHRADFNKQRDAAREARWLEAKKPCANCGEDIGPDRRRGSVYCSDACKAAAQGDRWRAKAPGYMREYLYGITREQYAELLESQGRRCAICRSDTPGGKGDWHLDHDHATGRRRGLLCHACNIALGYLEDDPERLRAAIEYLAAHRDKVEVGPVG